MDQDRRGARKRKATTAIKWVQQEDVYSPLTPEDPEMAQVYWSQTPYPSTAGTPTNEDSLRAPAASTSSTTSTVPSDWHNAGTLGREDTIPAPTSSSTATSLSSTACPMSFDFPWSVPDACYGQSQLRDLAGQISDSYSGSLQNPTTYNPQLFGHYQQVPPTARKASESGSYVSENMPAMNATDSSVVYTLPAGSDAVTRRNRTRQVPGAEEADPSVVHVLPDRASAAGSAAPVHMILPNNHRPGSMYKVDGPKADMTTTSKISENPDQISDLRASHLTTSQAAQPPSQSISSSQAQPKQTQSSVSVKAPVAHSGDKKWDLGNPTVERKPGDLSDPSPAHLMSLSSWYNDPLRDPTFVGHSKFSALNINHAIFRDSLGLSSNNGKRSAAKCRPPGADGGVIPRNEPSMQSARQGEDRSRRNPPPNYGNARSGTSRDTPDGNHAAVRGNPDAPQSDKGRSLEDRSRRNRTSSSTSQSSTRPPKTESSSGELTRSPVFPGYFPGLPITNHAMALQAAAFARNPLAGYYTWPPIQSPFMAPHASAFNALASRSNPQSPQPTTKSKRTRQRRKPLTDQTRSSESQQNAASRDAAPPDVQKGSPSSKRSRGDGPSSRHSSTSKRDAPPPSQQNKSSVQAGSSTSNGTSSSLPNFPARNQDLPAEDKSFRENQAAPTQDTLLQQKQDNDTETHSASVTENIPDQGESSSSAKVEEKPSLPQTVCPSQTPEDQAVSRFEDQANALPSQANQYPPQANWHQRLEANWHQPQVNWHQQQTDLNQPQTSLHQPQTSLQQPQTSLQQPQTSLQHPQTSLQHPQTSLQHPQTSLQHPQTNGYSSQANDHQPRAEVQSFQVNVSQRARPVLSAAAESGLGPRGPDFGTPPPLIYAGDLLADQPRPDNGQSASTRHTANIWEAYYNDVERELTVGDPEVGSGQRRESETGEIVDEEGNSDDDDDDDDNDNDMSDGDDDSDDDEGSLTMNDSDDDEGSLTMNDSTCGEDSPDGEKDECEKQKLQSCASG